MNKIGSYPIEIIHWDFTGQLISDKIKIEFDCGTALFTNTETNNRGFTLKWRLRLIDHSNSGNFSFIIEHSHEFEKGSIATLSLPDFMNILKNSFNKVNEYYSNRMKDSGYPDAYIPFDVTSPEWEITYKTLQEQNNKSHHL